MQDFTTILVAVIGASSTIIAALLTRYGIFFWRPAKVIFCSGHAVALRVIRKDDSFLDFLDKSWRQELEDLKIVLRGNHASVTSNYKLYKESELRLRGIFEGHGDFANGCAYLSYTIKDSKQNQTISGVLQLIIPEWGDITGYYLAQSSTEAGGVVVGKVHLARLLSSSK